MALIRLRTGPIVEPTLFPGSACLFVLVSFRHRDVMLRLLPTHRFSPCHLPPPPPLASLIPAPLKPTLGSNSGCRLACSLHPEAQEGWSPLSAGCSFCSNEALFSLFSTSFHCQGCCWSFLSHWGRSQSGSCLARREGKEGRAPAPPLLGRPLQS